MRVLITGGSGLFGSKLAEVLAESDYHVYSGYLEHVPTHGEKIRIDITDEGNVERVFNRVRPDVVVHAAAFTNVDKCELEREIAYKVNVIGTRYVVNNARKYSSFLVYVSTDYVFDGSKGLYREKDEPNPVNYYGYTKLMGEYEVINNLSEYCIVRPSVIYGSTPASGKTNFVLWVIDKLSGGERIKIVVDQWISPTLNTNLSVMVKEVIERKLSGIFHLSGATRISRFDFVKAIAKVFDLEVELVIPISMDQLSWVAKRPRDSSLDVSKAMKVLRNKPLDVEASLNILKGELSPINY